MKFVFYTLVLLFLTSCAPLQNFGFQFSSSSYDRYLASLRKASLDDTSMGKDWIAAGMAALQDSSFVQPPFQTTAYFAANRINAQSYRMNLQAGQKIYIQLKSTPRGFELFHDLFFYKKERQRYIDISPLDLEERKLEYNIRNTGEYVLRIQPRLLTGGRYDLEIDFVSSK
ncbi:MAG: hypothetical protein AAF849_08065 [Bacteroidota bacterium]